MIKEIEIKRKLLKKYAIKIATTNDFYVGYYATLPQKKIENFLKKFKNKLYIPSMDKLKQSIIGFYDTSVLGNGGTGYLFMEDKIYYIVFKNPKKIWYSDIKNMHIKHSHTAKKDNESEIFIKYTDDTSIFLDDFALNKTPMLSFLGDIVALGNKDKDFFKDTNCNISKNNKDYGKISGIATSNYENINKSFNEEKFHADKGHGFAAERANDINDKLAGHKTKILGDDNAKNGPDRICDGILIQSKYCKTGSRCVKECFENKGKGTFRYIDGNGMPMKIEVPKDKYNDAIVAMQEKIKKGQVPNITDINEATNIIKEGSISYQQAKNIAKAGSIDSLIYDAKSGMIIARNSMGVSFVVEFAYSLWMGKDAEVAFSDAFRSCSKTFGLALTTTVLAGQLSKVGMNSAMVDSTEKFAKFMGNKVCSNIANATRNGKAIHGAAAAKSTAKIIRGNVVSAIATITILSAIDITELIRKRISTKQLFKNFIVNIAGITGGIVGGTAGGTAGNVVGPAGGVLGAISGGTLGYSKASNMTKKWLDKFIEDDIVKLYKIIETMYNSLASDYLLNEKEVEKTLDILLVKLNGKFFKDMYEVKNKQLFARDFIEPIIVEQVKKRPIVSI